jgi:hypothetical protein
MKVILGVFGITLLLGAVWALIWWLALRKNPK